MAFTFDASPGSATGNSYATTAEADDYFAARLNASAWTTALSGNDPAKQQALAAGTARLEQSDFVGQRSTNGQRLRWPRVNVYDRDGYALDTATVPRAIKEALFELVLDWLNAGTTDRLATTGLEAFDEISVGPIDLKIRRDAPTPGALPPTVLRILSPYLLTAPGLVRLERA